MMLHIRKEQNDELAKVQLKKFEDRMVVHLNKFFPEECEMLGDECTRQAIRQAHERAVGYGIVSERDVCMYTDVMFAFGRDFDKSRKLPWAARILNDESLKDEPSEKAERLYHIAMNNTEQANGIKAETEGLHDV
ncbi:MAG: hypothetical protein ACYTFW_09275 [Planctomycetota bacterium]|jgi:hypothetical protein